MPRVRPFAAVLFFVAQVYAVSNGPSVRSVYRPAPPSIVVTASDSVGLDVISISCPALDLTYTTQLSRAATDKRFERSFPLGEILPGWERAGGPLRVIVTVRNTRGVSASASIAVPSASSGNQK